MEEDKDVSAHYDARAESYHLQYERDRLYTNQEYPANYFRLQLLLNSFLKKGIKRVIEVGVGEGTPLGTLAQAGIDIWGFDISDKMVEMSRQNMVKHDLDPNHIFWGDIQDPITYIHALKNGLFDGTMAMGVMPHVADDDMVLENIGSLIKPGGSVFIEFRNKLFSLFTFNRYTYEFILDDLLKDVGKEIRDVVAEELKTRVHMDLPPVRQVVAGTDAPGYDAITSRFHNPFEVIELFQKHNYTDIELSWYHYHPAMPYLEGKLPKAFRAEAIKLEHEPSGWRGFFLCSAFVVEAVKKG